MRIWTVLVWIVAAGLISLAHADDQEKSPKAAAKPKGAPPPATWDARVKDVFFPDARAALVGPRPAYASGGKGGSANGGDGSGAAGQAGGTSAWSKLISADTLQDEIKSLQPQLKDDVGTLQGFLGGGNKKARQALSQLAAEFAIVSEYDGDVRWKNQAAAARDLFAKAGFNCKAATDATFREAKNRSEDLLALTRGDSITAPPGLEPKTDWPKVSNLSPLMTRLELAQRDRIAAATSNAGEFKKNAAQLTHEAELVAAFAEVIARPGMDNADDEKFRGYAKTLQQTALDIREAVKADNYGTAQTAAGAMAKTCVNCHSDFR